MKISNLLSVNAAVCILVSVYRQQHRADFTYIRTYKNYSLSYILQIKLMVQTRSLFSQLITY